MEDGFTLKYEKILSKKMGEELFNKLGVGRILQDIAIDMLSRHVQNQDHINKFIELKGLEGYNKWIEKERAELDKIKDDIQELDYRNGEAIEKAKRELIKELAIDYGIELDYDKW